MDVYRTEEEQIEAIKKFAAEYGNKVMLAIVACIVLFFGYQAWEQKQQSAKDTVSLYYNELNEALGAGQEVTDENRAKFDVAYAKLLNEYPKTIYASYAALLKAKLDVDKGELDKAAESLQWVVSASVNRELVALANLRLARVEFARGNVDQGLALLQKDAGPFAAEYEEAKGDMLLEKSQADQALIAYKKAQSLQEEAATFSNRILEMKIETLETADKAKLFPVSPVAATVDSASSEEIR